MTETVMTETATENVEETAGVYKSERKKYVSDRGPFEIWENPTITPTPAQERIENASDDAILGGLDFSVLAEKFGEGAAQSKIVELFKAIAPGNSTTILFGQRGPNGMSLAHVWFGANFPLFRHSHPAYGDCLYYVIHGELRVGKRRLGAGSGLFVPNGQPYKYTAGPAGVELLEFRAGGGTKGAPGLKMDELSLDSIQKLTDQANANRDHWRQPEKIGDTAYFQQELDLG